MLTAYAIILAAGYSSRMGRCKATLSLGDKTALQTLSDSFIQAGVIPIVVTGFAQKEVEQECRRLKIQTVHNNNFHKGMFSSVQAGCKALPDDADLFFVTPVDIPLIRPRTIRELLAHAETTKTTVLHPLLDNNEHAPLPDFLHDTEGQTGHPPCLRISLKKDILEYSGEGGLAMLLSHHAAATSYLPVVDSNMLEDMDTPKDYIRLYHLQELQTVPSLQECYAIWNLLELPAHIRRHSLAVADVARIMLADLPEATPLFVQTVIAGAMLHDIVKGQPNHAEAGAQRIAELGFPSLAPCIAAHSYMSAQQGAVTEAELVFLADKFVEGTERCTLASRYEKKMVCYAESKEAVEAIQQKLLQAQSVLDKVESVTATDYDMLFAPVRKG